MTGLEKRLASFMLTTTMAFSGIGIASQAKGFEYQSLQSGCNVEKNVVDNDRVMLNDATLVADEGNHSIVMKKNNPKALTAEFVYDFSINNPNNPREMYSFFVMLDKEERFKFYNMKNEKGNILSEIPIPIFNIMLADRIEESVNKRDDFVFQQETAEYVEIYARINQQIINYNNKVKTEDVKIRLRSANYDEVLKKFASNIKRYNTEFINNIRTEALEHNIYKDTYLVFNILELRSSDTAKYLEKLMEPVDKKEIKKLWDNRIKNIGTDYERC